MPAVRAASDASQIQLALGVYDIIEQLRTPNEMAGYLDAWFHEVPEDAAGIVPALAT